MLFNIYKIKNESFMNKFLFIYEQITINIKLNNNYISLLLMNIIITIKISKLRII